MDRIEGVLRARSRRRGLAAFEALRPLFETLASGLSLSWLKTIGRYRRTTPGIEIGGMALARRLQREFRQEFPDETRTLERYECSVFFRAAVLWRRLLDGYDIVIGYGLDPIVPLQFGTAWFAFEHGTLREFPFRDDGFGKLVSLAYRRAAHVFVTNVDCMSNAQNLAGKRVTSLNHPFDERHGDGVISENALRRRLETELDADFLFFFPTRQDWVHGTGFSDKGNDVFLRAFGALRRAGHRVGVICCRWGRNVADSESLIAELGCAAHVKWRAPMGLVQFERMCKACDVVVDQFQLGALGGVSMKSMAAGVPVCTYLDEELASRSFPRVPPILNCKNEEEIIETLTHYISDRSLLGRRSEATRIWTETYHSAAATVAAQVEVFAGSHEAIGLKPTLWKADET